MTLVVDSRIHLRPGQPEDAPAISALIRQFSGQFTLAPDGTGAEQFFESISLCAEAAYLAAPRYRYIVATQGTALAGFVALRDRSHVFHLFVDAAFQRRGLATRLWSAAKSSAAGVDTFTVNSSPLAQPVYERFGFVASGPRVEVHGIAFVPMRLAHTPGRGFFRAGDVAS